MAPASRMLIGLPSLPPLAFLIARTALVRSEMSRRSFSANDHDPILESWRRGPDRRTSQRVRPADVVMGCRAHWIKNLTWALGAGTSAFTSETNIRNG